MRWPIPFIIVFLLTACGQKGDLYLPDQDKSGQAQTIHPTQAKA